MVVNYSKSYILFLLLTFFWLCDCQQLAGFKKLLDVDNELSTFSQDLINVIPDHGLDEIQKEILKNVDIVGSMGEGSTTARVFQPILGDEKLNKELNVDLEFTLMVIPINNKKLVKDIPGKEGVVKIGMDKDIIRLARLSKEADPKELKSFLSKVSKSGYIKPNRFKEEMCKKIKIKNHEDEIKLILSAALDIEFNSITLSHFPKEDPCSFITNYIDVLVDDKLELKVSWNLVPVIKVSWWPEVAAQWINRERKWPSNDVINELTQFSYISANLSTESKASSELRYSFTHIERFLSSKRSRQQALVYLVFKSLIYRWIKPIDTHHISSYIAKTIMFWACEKYPPDHLIWNESATIHALTYLFNELSKAIKENYLPNYFIPKINVIKNLKGDTREKVMKQIEHIISNTNEVLPNNVNEAVVTYQKILLMLKVTHKAMNDVKNEYYDIFIKRPDLIPKALEIFGSQLLSIGKEKKEDFSKQLDDVKDTINEKWNQFQEDLNLEDVKKNVKETINQVKEQFDLNDLEKKAKDFLKKFEL